MASSYHAKKRPLYLTPKDIDKDENNQQSFCLSRGTYGSTRYFANAQFWLLREKVFHSFQKGIQEYRKNKNDSCGIIYFQYGLVYTNGTLYKKNLKFLGDVYTVRIEIKTGISHDFSRYLQQGDVICMSADKFDNFIFAEVISCEKPPYHKQFCRLEITVDKTYFESKLKFRSSYHILATGTSHAYQIQSLRKLKSLSKDDLALTSALLSLLGLENCDKSPPYCPDLEFPGVTYGEKSRCLTKETTFVSSLDTMGKKQFDLDKQQTTAFKVALTNQVAVIDGYPGSGKTFLCIALMRYLLAPERKESLVSPILFLCNTESCLDHQLECMLSYTENITRIGGSSKSEKMENCKLSYRRRNINPDNVADCARNVTEGDCKIKKTNRVEPAKDKNKLSLFKTCTKRHQVPSKNVKSYSTGCLDRLGTNRDTSNESTEFFNDTDDEVNEIGLDSFLNDTNKEIAKITAIANKILLFPLNDLDIVQKIVPENLHRSFTSVMKPLKRTESREGKVEYNTQLKNAVVQWLCLTPKDLDSIKENSDFLRDVLLSYQKKHGFLSYASVGESHMNSEQLRKYNALLEMIFSPDGDTFPIIEEAALKYLRNTKSKQASSSYSLPATTFSNTNIWQLAFLQRYQEFSMWKQIALRKVNQKRISLEKICQNRIEMVKKDIMMRSVSCCLKSDIVGMRFRCAVQHPQFLEKISPKVVIVDESDEVLEGEIVTSLPTTVQHLILLRNAPYQPPCRIQNQACLMTLPGRLKKCGAPSGTLKIQHRMRPSIWEMLFNLDNENVEYSPDIINLIDIESVSSNVFFIEHKQNIDADNQDHVLGYNTHEAKFLLCFINYLARTSQPEIRITLLVSSTEQMDLVNGLSKKNGIAAKALHINDFRGEEADIVLLSLANKQKCDPMRIFNYLHASITRARIGFFCIGNFDLYTKHCSYLQNFMKNVRSKGLSGEALLLRCTKHPKILTPVSTSKDFKNIRSSGCSINCKK